MWRAFIQQKGIEIKNTNERKTTKQKKDKREEEKRRKGENSLK